MARVRYATPRRGEVWRVAFDPAVGHEVQKTRPAVVVTHDVYNSENWVVLVVPLTSSDAPLKDQVFIVPPEGGLPNPSVTLPDQLRAIDRRRLVKRLGRLDPATMIELNQTLIHVLNLLPPGREHDAIV